MKGHMRSSEYLPKKDLNSSSVKNGKSLVKIKTFPLLESIRTMKIPALFLIACSTESMSSVSFELNFPCAKYLFNSCPIEQKDKKEKRIGKISLRISENSIGI
jgi:hypothetical protein